MLLMEYSSSNAKFNKINFGGLIEREQVDNGRAVKYYPMNFESY